MTIGDVSLLLGMVGGMRAVPSMTVCDVFPTDATGKIGDGEVNMLDAVALLRQIQGLGSA